LKEVKAIRNEQTKWRTEEQNRKILTWLSPQDFSERQKAILERRHLDTGKWFLEQTEFISWQNGAKDCNAGLWCLGHSESFPVVLGEKLR
jgi:hypothetical protein